MERNLNINEISLNFNLREPCSNKSTNIYAVLRCNKVQYKVPTGRKCKRWQWNKRQQIPIISMDMSTNDIEYNKRTFEILSKIRFGFLDYFTYICTVEDNISEKELVEYLKELIKNLNDMANNENLRKSVTRTPKATTLLKRAFDIYYSEVRQAKESAKQAQLSHLKAYISYCEGIGEDKMSMLSQKGINDYKSYLIKTQAENKANGKKRYASNTAINAKCELVERLINKVISKHNNFLRYKIQEVKYQKLEELNIKGEDKKRRPLKPEELEKLKQCNDLTGEEREYRDLFILECYCAYRIGDTAKLFDKKLQRKYTEGGIELIMIETQKENIDAIIWVTNEVKDILERYENGFKYVKEPGSTQYRDKFNRIIKKIAKKAQLDSIETYTDSHGEKKSQPLYKIISSHFGRYTFIYNGLFHLNLSPNDLKDFTGHADDKMINEVYSIYTKDDKAKKAFRTIAKITGKQVEEPNTTRSRITKDNINEQDDLIREVKDALFCLGADLNDLADINDYHELNVILYNDYHRQLVELGIDKDVKEVYRLDGLTLKEKRMEIKKLKDKITLIRFACEKTD